MSDGGHELGLFIGQSWRMGEGRDAHVVVDPSSGEAIGSVPLATAADLDEALDAAARAFPVWRSTDVDTRGAILRRTAALIRERTDAIATILTREQGKPLTEARGELLGSAQMFDFFAEEARRNYGRVLVRPTGQRSIVVNEPVGPVAALSPWNFPVYLMAKKLAPALAAGCTVIAKPPEETPGCTGALMQCLIDAGLPPGVCQSVHGVPDMVSRHLLASPVIRKLSFTGSVPVGRHLMHLAADGLKRVTMELGGHAPVLVFDDCELETTLDMLVAQKFRNAGQVCVSPTRFYVQDAIYDRFAAGFADRTAVLRVGNGLSPGTQMGPLANRRRPDAIATLVDDATAKGARVLAGGSRDTQGFFFRPTVLANVPEDAAIMSAEPFGPVAALRPFASEEDAIEAANRLPYGLAAFVFTQNGRRANRLADAIEAGMIGVNNFAISSADAPFGGIKDSGFGSEGGPEGFLSYCHTKAIHQA
jgi:succinate-semialdehyde dehydrogenase / glutarate-semialdehyde dehydrogenase